jgi:peptidoglycan/LPS O-acetylase OafA/YrhL
MTAETGTIRHIDGDDARDRAGLSNFNYRAEIDGLRCIGVLSVILFHLGTPFVSGGFIGVDIFFVISGYLITQRLAKDIDQGCFSLIGFYERRIRRIIPALFAMVTIVSLFAYATLIPVYYIRFVKSATAAAFSASNVYFWKHTSYFDIGSDYHPLLHTWSLGVEEQFYILFPILFFFCRRCLRLRWAWTIFPLFAASLVFGIIQTEPSLKIAGLIAGTIPTNIMSPSAAFFLPVSRFWEFLMGSALAVGAIASIPKRKLIRNGTALLGCVLILISVFIFNRSTTFPGVAALIPCLGSAMIIYANTNYTTIVGRVLGAYPIVWVGMISYSLYLWHWPLISFMRLIWGSEQPFLAYLALFVSMFPIGWLSWRFVERPVRSDRHTFTQRRLFALAGIGALILLGFGGFASRRQGLPTRFSTAALTIADGAMDIDARSEACADKPVSEIMAGQVCTIGRVDAPVTFALIGDSFAVALSPGVEAAANQAGRRGLVLTHSGCYALLGIKSDPGCQDFIDAAIAQVKVTPSIETVILVSRWTVAVEGSRFGAIDWKDLFITDEESRAPSYAENKAVFARGLERNAKALMGYKIFVVAFVPEQLTLVPEAAALRVNLGFSAALGTPRTVVDKRQQSVRQMLTTAALRYGFSIIDVTPPLCDTETCYAIEGGRSLYHDDNHLSRVGAIRLAAVLAAAFMKPEGLR